MRCSKKTKCLIITFGPYHDKPWWWRWTESHRITCNLEYVRISLGSKKSKDLTIFQIPTLAKKLFRLLLEAKGKYEFIFTFECDWTSLIISFLQTALHITRPKHVILQFIMREREDTWRSKAKYVFMKYIFKSVYLCICSSAREIEHYKKEFNWQSSKLGFVPFHTDPDYLKYPEKTKCDFILSVGRSFRDYNTLIDAVRGINIDTIIIASKHNVLTKCPTNVRVEYDQSMDVVCDYIARSRLVVLPLQDRQISIGQSVLLQAMAMGKPVIVTRTSGTEDYVEDRKTGVFVKPHDVDELRNKILFLYNNSSARETLGLNAKKTVIEKYLPMNYVEGVSYIISR